MERLVRKYIGKLEAQGLAYPDQVLLGGLDADVYWSRKDPLEGVLSKVFDGLNINSLLCGKPKEPYASIIEYLCQTCDGAIFPKDSETRTFLHDLPISKEFSADKIVHFLKRRKSVLLPGGSIASFGTVSPEEAFVTFSSVCFACYVKFMSDCLVGIREGKLSIDAKRVLDLALGKLVYPPTEIPKVAVGPFDDEDSACGAIIEAGRLTVENNLVDSHFGNVSYLVGNTLYISQSGASLDEMEGCIDPCPLDGTSSAGMTASSELTAHLRILEATGTRAILHGHPKFSVTMSLDCTYTDCKDEGRCHTRCEKERFIGDIPIVPGEVGTGRFGLCNTVPSAMPGNRGVIVFGHGLFTAAKNDYQQALGSLFNIEHMCIDEFIKLAG